MALHAEGERGFEWHARQTEGMTRQFFSDRGLGALLGAATAGFYQGFPSR